MDRTEIEFQNVSFQYEGQNRESIHQVDLKIRQGEFVVFIGESGCGKTTLTRCINNLVPQFFEGKLEGEICVLGCDTRESSAGQMGKQVASIFQDPRSQFFTTNSSCEVAFVCENYGVPHEEIVKRVNSVFKALEIEKLEDKSVFELSSGERQKIAFAAAMTLNPKIYVLDEPSANLDIRSILQIRDILMRLKLEGHTIVISEHRLFWLKGLADRFIRMVTGKIVEQFTSDKLLKLSYRELEKRRIRSLSLEDIPYCKKTFSCPQKVPLICIRNLEFSYPSENELLNNISFEATKGEVIALLGENGCGKSTLGKILSGLQKCRKGMFYFSGQPIKQSKLCKYVYFVMQEADHQLYTDSVESELKLGNEKISGVEEKMVNTLRALKIEEFRNFHPYALSGGQKQRVTIATAMMSEKPILILDEPTSGLDYTNMKAVADAVNQLREEGKLVFIITHDLEFLNLTATRAFLLKEGRLWKDILIDKEEKLTVIRQFMELNHVNEGGKKV